MSTLRYFMYLRKSSESEERQELSIPAQLRELTAFADRRELTIIGEPFEESQSAMTPGRPIFGKMMKAIARRQADAILVWKIDRLARNPLDSGHLMQSLADDALKEITTPDYAYTRTGADKLLMALQFSMATKYSDDLSDNVRRGNREALLRGFWPNRPPLGYRRDHDTNRIVPDPERFPVIQEMWRMLLSGVPVMQILDFSRARGLTTPEYKSYGGGTVTRAVLYRLFQNVFYAGAMAFSGQVYPGTHQPMLTIAEFDQARAILAGRQTWIAPVEKPFYVYRGLVRCGSCGGQVTVKTSTNSRGSEYIHYYCWKKNTAHLYCPEGSVQEADIDRAVLDFLGELQLPPAWMKAVFKKLDTLKSEAEVAAEKSHRQHQENLRRVEARLERLRVLLVDETITPDDYARDRSKFVGEQLRLQELVATPPCPTDYLEHWREGFSLLSGAKNLFTTAEPEKKRELVKSFTLNIILKDKKLLIEAKKPFSIFREGRGCPGLRAFWDFLRTHILTHTDPLGPLSC